MEDSQWATRRGGLSFSGSRGIIFLSVGHFHSRSSSAPADARAIRQKGEELKRKKKRGQKKKYQVNSYLPPMFSFDWFPSVWRQLYLFLGQRWRGERREREKDELPTSLTPYLL